MKLKAYIGRFSWSAIVVLCARPAAGLPVVIAPGAQPEVILQSSEYYEGPSWDRVDERLYFTQLTGGSRVLRLTPPSSVSHWLTGSQGINGTFLGNDGRLLCAQGDTKRIMSYRIGASGPEDAQILAQNNAWLAPNDLCQAPNGDIYFTTPDWNYQNGRVYRLDPNGTVTPVISSLGFPNGVLTSLDGQTLYVSDSQSRRWYSYPILANGTLGPQAVFFDPDTPDTAEPDGMSIDEFGNLYFAGRGGIWAVAVDGTLVDMVPVSEFVSNVTFGGSDGRTLYLTCQDKLYSLAMAVRGGAWQDVPDPNHAPNVDVGPNRVVASLTQTTQLSATITDDGLPNPPGAIATTQWTQQSGPAGVVLSSPASASTQATFPTIGQYVLRCTVFDGERAGADELTISVADPGDLDADGDIDGDDAQTLADCLTGSNAGPPITGCEVADIDSDNDVDSRDFGVLQRCLTGSGVAADPVCVQ